MARRGKANPILDVRTKKQYRSKAAAGRALAHLVDGDPEDNFVWYKLRRSMPERFRVMNAAGDWVSLDDPSAPIGTLRDEEQEERTDVGRVRLTTLHIDDDKFEQVKAILGTGTLRETVDRSFDEVLARDARAKSIARLQKMEGLDLDKKSVMDRAWR